MFFKKRNKSIFSIEYYSNGDYNICLPKQNVSEIDANHIGSFLHLLMYNSPISADIIDKLKSIKNSNNKHIVDYILSSWATNYLNDKHKPMIDPLLTFKQNVR
jgi:hypothetical protein